MCLSSNHPIFFFFLNKIEKAFIYFCYILLIILTIVSRIGMDSRLWLSEAPPSDDVIIKVNLVLRNMFKLFPCLN